MGEWSYVFALLGIAVSAATFFAGRRSASKQEGVENGRVLTEIGYIKSGIDDIKRKQEKADTQYVEIISRVTALEASAKQAHRRLDRMEAQPKE